MPSTWKSLHDSSSTTQADSTKRAVPNPDEVCPLCKDTPAECECHLCIDTLADDEEMTEEQIAYVDDVKRISTARNFCWKQFEVIRKVGRDAIIPFADKLTFDKLYALLYGEERDLEDELLSKK